MGSWTQNYYGTDTTIGTAGCELRTREELARMFGLDKLPPKDAVITKDADTSKWDKFTFNRSGVEYKEIIGSITEFDADKKSLEVNNGEVGIYLNTDEDIEYILSNYSNELKERLNSFTVLSGFAKVNSSKAEHESNAFALPKVATTHIDDKFMEPATPVKPVAPITPVQTTKESKPAFMTNLKNRLDASSSLNTAGTIYSLYPFLKEIEDKIKADGVLTVAYEMESGLIKMKVSSTEKPEEVMDKYSITFDLGGAIVTPNAKWWPGVNHKTPVDFMQAYKYDVKAIQAYLAGETIPEEYICFNEGVANLNKIVDLRTVFSIDKITDEDAGIIMKNIKEATDKLSAKIDSECKGMRFSMGTYTNKETFELTTVNTTYDRVGGKLTNSGAAVRLQIASKKAPKLLK